MKKGLTLTFLLSTLFAATHCNNAEKKLFANDIKGTWYLNKWTTYHTLTFDDWTVFVDNHVDTIFTLKYFIDDNLLLTTTPDSQRQIVDTILMLTSDSLILSGIHDTKEKRAYSRTKRKWNE